MGFSEVNNVFIVPIFDVFWAIQFFLLIYSVLIFTHVFSNFLLLVKQLLNIIKEATSQLRGLDSVPLTQLEKPS